MRVLINIDVDDIERGVTFYERALGFRCSRRLFNGSVAELVGANCRVFLLRKASGSECAPDIEQRRGYTPHWTPVHLDFEVDDVEAVALRACGAGARLVSGVDRFAWGEQAVLRDPFGHGFCLLRLASGDYLP